MSKPPEPQPILVFPLFGQKQTALTEQDLVAVKRQARRAIRHNANNEGVREMFNMVERIAGRLNADAITRDADKHDQGRADGALHVMNVLRACLEGTEIEDENGETAARA